MFNRIGIKELDVATRFGKACSLVSKPRHPRDGTNIFEVVDDVKIRGGVRDVGDVDAVHVEDAVVPVGVRGDARGVGDLPCNLEDTSSQGASIQSQCILHGSFILELDEGLSISEACFWIFSQSQLLDVPDYLEVGGELQLCDLSVDVADEDGENIQKG